MKVVIFLNGLGLGGVEKAASRWGLGLRDRGHSVSFISLTDGKLRFLLEEKEFEVNIVPQDKKAIADSLKRFSPDVIHAHCPGYSHPGDILGAVINDLKKSIPVVQSNVFGRLENPRENNWTRFRLFVSWTSAVQAARRAFLPLNTDFFRYASVASNPLDSDSGPSASEILDFRSKYGIKPNEILFGRFSRPAIEKWTDLPLLGFVKALENCPNIKLLLREPPLEVAQRIQELPQREKFIVLPITSDPCELRLTQASIDVVLHGSSIGESFGYGIAEPMNYGKPAIANSVPWGDQAQIEMIMHGKGGFIASTTHTMQKAIQTLARDIRLRQQMGQFGQQHVRQLADPEKSLDRLEMALKAAIQNEENPMSKDDLEKALETAKEMDRIQFGSSVSEQLTLRSRYYRLKFSAYRKNLKDNFRFN